MTPPDIRPRILDSDKVGRDVLSRNDRRLIMRGQAPPGLFLDNISPARLSVHRLAPVPNRPPPDDRSDLAPDSVIAEISRRRAKAQTPERNFYGWAELSAADAARDGREVCLSPRPDNPWHADIVLPAEAEREERKREKHAMALSHSVEWRERPD